MPTASVYHCVVKLPPKSGIPQDVVENTFTFTTTDNLHANRVAVVGLLNSFYTAIPSGGTRAVGAYLSDVIRRDVEPTVSFYDVTAHLAGGGAGSPIEVLPLTTLLPAASGSNLPAEVAICLSYNATYGGTVEFGPHTRPRARLRGRVFIGPLLQLAMATDTTTRRNEVAAAAMTDISKAGAALKASVDPIWSTWSRKAGVSLPVAGGWVDDAFDTQRRRGEAAVTRTTF